MKFQIGDRVRLIDTYWVERKGDCKTDGNVGRLGVGEAVGTVEDTDGVPGVLIVKWESISNQHYNSLRVNEACLEPEVVVTDEDVEAALRSIATALPEGDAMTGYHDPSRQDPQFPSRPTHEDFQRLSNSAQGMDLRAEAGAEVPDIHGLDETSLNYFIYNRLGVLGKKIGTDLQTPLMMALYMDGLTVGTLAEAAREECPFDCDHCRE